MSYPVDIDEVSDETLIKELGRRQNARANGRCAYCNYSADHSDFPKVGARSGQPQEHCLRPQIGTTPVLTFERLRGKNTQRLAMWHDDSEEWSGADWSNAMLGEVGEMVEAAQDVMQVVVHAGAVGNIIKKIRRHETHLGESWNTPDKDTLMAKLAEELADVITYADLLANHYSIDLTTAVIDKFNKVSDGNGFAVKL